MVHRMKPIIQLKILARRRGLLLRGLLCWAIGCLILTTDEMGSYDTRFNLRGEQAIDSNIVLLTIRSSDLEKIYHIRSSELIARKEIAEFSDSFYWDKKLWLDVLGKILESKPRKIGVSFFFGPNLGPVDISKKDAEIIKDHRIIWATSTMSSAEHMPRHLLANDLISNIGANDLLPDEDGVVRRFAPRSANNQQKERREIPHMTELLAERRLTSNASKLINYRGHSGRFPQFNLEDLLAGKVPTSAIKDRIVIIGPDSNMSVQLNTPVGFMRRAEVLANIVDNLSKNRWILRLPTMAYAVLLLLILGLCMFLITQYPQSVALFFLLWLATVSSALSAWIFDLYYIWTPAVSTAILISAIWVIFVGYQANRIERKNWELQQEQIYLQELEQIKNNFVSLISHDLKTPLAKITAIAERLLSQFPQHEFVSDLKSLRGSADELNQYIKSILQVLRVESRDFKIHKEIGDVNQLISQAIHQLRPLAFEKQISLKEDLEPMFSMEVDFTLIREVMVNLIENAIKYTPNSGQVFIRSLERQNKVFIEVQDTGPGIPKEEIPTIWGKFVRGKDQDLKTKGTGLGLYLVKYFIELHGGDVYLESELGKGTKVSISLPIEENFPNET